MTMRLTLEIVEEMRQSAVRELDLEAARTGTVNTCQSIVDSIVSAAPQAAAKDLFRQIFRTIWFLEHASQDAKSSVKTCEELMRIATFSLNILGVKPYKSKFSYLYRMLYNARAKFLSQSLDPWHSVWSIRLGETMDGTELRLNDAQQLRILLIEAHQYLRCGFVSDALVLFQKAESHATIDNEAWPIRLDIVRCLRMLNQPRLALDALRIFSQQDDLPQDISINVAWETAFVSSQLDRNSTPVLQLIEQSVASPETMQAEYLPIAILWCYASKQRSAIEKLPSASWLKTRISARLDPKLGPNPIKLITYIENFYSTDATIFHKLMDVGDVLGDLRSEPASAELVVFFAAVARCLLRVKQKASAALAINIYQSFSTAMSSGRTHSLFELLEDIGDSLNASAESSRATVVSQGVKSGLERTFLYIEIVSRLLAMAVVAKAKKLNQDVEDQSYKQDILIKLSDFFVRYASGAMKGPIHKLGQVVLNLVDLPEKAQSNFKSVLWSKSIVHETLMRRVLEEELNKKVDEVFASFDWNPIGVGSVSQVYRAELKTGEEVAVKIQYPDLAKVVKQDLNMFARIMTAIRWMFPRNDLRAINTFLLDVYQRETNFLTEIEVAKVLQRIVERGARWRIPKFFAHLCSQRVLVSELIQGVNFYEFSETASLTERTEVARAMHQFGMLSILEGQMICLDPHPANLILSEDDIYIIDFGCFVPLTADFVAVVREIQLSYLSAEEARVEEQLNIYRQAGVIKKHPDVQEKDVREFVEILIQQMNWEACLRPGLQQRFHELYLKQGLNKVFGSNSPEFALGFVAQLLMIRTISKFGVPAHQTLVNDIASEIAGRFLKQDRTNEQTGVYLDVS